MRAAISRRAIASALIVTLGAARAPAAPPDKAACLAAYEGGQRARLRGELRAAREQLLVCARDPCPAALHASCGDWLSDVERRMPSVVVEVTFPDGHAPSTATIAVDGAVLGSALDGRAFDVEPGRRSFRVEAEGASAVEQTVVILEGEKARKLRFALAPPAPPPALRPLDAIPPPRAPADHALVRPIPWPTYVFGATGAIALGSFAFFGIRGVAQRGDLDGCRGTCAAADVDADRQKFLAADISLAVAAVSLGLATYFFLSRPTIASHDVALRAP